MKFHPLKNSLSKGFHKNLSISLVPQTDPARITISTQNFEHISRKCVEEENHVGCGGGEEEGCDRHGLKRIKTLLLTQKVYVHIKM